MKMMKFNGTSVSYPSSVSNLSNFRILLFSIKNNTLAEIREEIDHRNRSSRNSKKKKKKKKNKRTLYNPAVEIHQPTKIIIKHAGAAKISRYKFHGKSTFHSPVYHTVYLETRFRKKIFHWESCFNYAVQRNKNQERSRPRIISLSPTDLRITPASCSGSRVTPDVHNGAP